MPINPAAAAQARAGLYEFLGLVYRLLDRLADDPRYRDPQGNGEQRLLFHEELVGPLRNGWAAFRNDWPVQRWQRLVADVSDTSLEDHGLYGTQLQSKRAMVDYRMDVFSSAAAGNPPPIAPAIPRGFVARQLVKLLEAIDRLLRSVLEAIGVGKALEEIKDTFLSAVNDLN
jgi:hypothetical protein